LPRGWIGKRGESESISGRLDPAALEADEDELLILAKKVPPAIRDTVLCGEQKWTWRSSKN
jgi:hypothetical protein